MVYPQLLKIFKYLRIYDAVCEWMCSYTPQGHEQIPSFKCSSACNISNVKNVKWDEVNKLILYLNQSKYLDILLDPLSLLKIVFLS